MKNNVLQLSHTLKTFIETSCTNNAVGEMFFQKMVSERDLLDGILWSLRVFFAFIEKRSANKILFMRDKFSFPYEDI